MYSPSNDTLEAPAARSSESQEDASDEEEEEEEEEDDGDSSRTVQRTPGDDFSASAAPTLVDGEAAASSNNPVIAAVPNLDALSHLREVGLSDAISWQLSSAKPGNGVEQLRDPSNETYWQSDGVSQPHWIQIHLHRRLPLTHVALYLDYHLDESYTPKTIRVETGMTTQDLCAGSDNMTMELHEPAGWCILPIQAPADPLSGDDATNAAAAVSKAHLIRISVLSMHQNGRDTHVRRLALFAERTYSTNKTAIALPLSRITGKRIQVDEDEQESWNHRQHRSTLTSDFATLGMNAYSTIR